MTRKAGKKRKVRQPTRAGDPRRGIALALARFLREGGVAASGAAHANVEVAGRRFAVPDAAVHDIAARSRWFSEVVMRAAGDRLASNARRHLAARPRSAFQVRREQRLLVLERDGKPVGVISPRHAEVVGMSRVAGNFLQPDGPHWTALAESLRNRFPDEAASPPREDAIAAVVAAFASLGADAEVAGAKAVLIGGRRLRVPEDVLRGTAPDRRRWARAAVDQVRAGQEEDRRIAPQAGGATRPPQHESAPMAEDLQSVGAELARLARRELPLAEHGVELQPHALAVQLRRRGETVAVVTATNAAVVGGGAVVDGNFRTLGPHWGRFAEALSGRQPERAPAPSAVPLPAPSQPAVAPESGQPFVLQALPSGLAGDVRDAATAASRRLRESRSLVFEHTVVVRAGDAEIRFRPLTRPPVRIAVPFTVTRGDRVVEGALRLVSSGDPLDCRFAAGTERHEAVDAWVLALLAYADLTCVEQAPLPAEPPRRVRARAGAGRGRASMPARRSEPSRGSRPSAVPAAFTPVGRTAGLMASYVAAHRRRLRPPAAASAEAVAAAHAVGIRLRPHETWVSAHFRGMSPDGELQFRWTVPRCLRGLGTR